MIFVSPRESELVRIDRETGRSLTLCDAPVYREFLVLEDRVFFRNTETGYICAVNTDGSNLLSYYQMPFCNGVMKDGVMYFINTEDNFENEAVLYSYEPLEGIWSTSILSGCYLSPVRRTVVFSDDAVYYISSTADAERIIRQSLDTGERTVVYTTGRSQTGCLTELYLSGDTLYFYDAAAGAICRYEDGDTEVQQLDLPGDRLYAVLVDGLLFASSEAGGSKLFFGNAAGQSAEYQGGVVMTAGASRALVRRSGDEGEDILAVVKYPEDEVQEQISGLMNYVATDNAGNAVVFFYGAYSCYYVDLNSGEIQEYEVEPLYLDRLPIDRYIAGEEEGPAVLAGFDLETTTPQQFARAFAAAVADGDRLSLAVLLSGRADLHAFPPVQMKSWRISRDETETDENRVTYLIEYTPYAQADMLYLQFAPAIISSCRLTFELNEDGWTLLPPEE